MAIRSILLDTNAYTAFKRNLPEAVEIIRHVPYIYLNAVVIGELLGGFAAGTRATINQQELTLFMNSSRVRVIAVDEATADFYATVYFDLRKKGRPIPTNDLWIAASARQHNLAVFTYDAHFQAIDDLVAGRDLADFIV